MKTWKHSSLHMVVKFSGINTVMGIALLLIGGYVTEAQDLKSFDNQESYLVDGTPIVLDQKVGQVSVEFKSPMQDTDTLTTGNGATFVRTFVFPDGLAIYELQPAGSATFAESAAAIDSLNTNTSIAFAYPVYVNPNTGNRIFLNNEIIVKFSGAPDASFELLFNLDREAQVSGNSYVFRLRDAKNLNPFKLCNAILALPNVVWAEPNSAAEATSFGPVGGESAVWSQPLILAPLIILDSTILSWVIQPTHPIVAAEAPRRAERQALRPIHRKSRNNPSHPSDAHPARLMTPRHTERFKNSSSTVQRNMKPARRGR